MPTISDLDNPVINTVKQTLKNNGIDVNLEEKLAEIQQYLTTHNNQVNMNDVMIIINRGLTELNRNNPLMQRLRSILSESNDLDMAVQRIEELKRQMLDEKYKNYYLINEQNLMMEDGIKRMMKESTTDNKRNYYQLEQNKNIHYVYKLMFWFYYLFVLIFILVFFIMSKAPLLVKGLTAVLFVAFPFLILPLEYAVVFVYYYLRSFLVTTPFRTADLPITMPIHAFEYMPADVLNFKNF